MSPTFRPQLDILPEPQRRLWPELAALPQSFTLYGGTAVALHLGHRQSIDFDFFIFEDFEPLTLFRSVPLLNGSEVAQAEKSTLTCILHRGGPVQLYFLGVPFLNRVHPVLRSDDIGLAVASRLDLGGSKAAVVQVRAEPKDYMDLAALLGAGLALSEMLAAAVAMYGHAFSPLSALKAIAYHEDSQISALPATLREQLRRAVSLTDPVALPNLQPIAAREDEA